MGTMTAGEMVMAWRNTKNKKPRQEICAPLKWFCFLLNFCLFLVGVTCLSLGIYLIAKEPRPITEWADIFLNPSLIITGVGLIICFISLCGLFGSLRDNVFLLKTYALCVFCAYILLVVATFVLFMLFYSDNVEGISVHSILSFSIKKYHTNRNIADFVDYVQEQLECCGTSSTAQGFRDWNMNEQFQCNQSNPYPERCGVPFSCCRKSFTSEAASSGTVNPLLPAIRSLQCWQNAQTKRESDLESDIYVRGCLQPMRILFEKYAVHLGIAVAIIILPVCFGVCLSQCLARQIDYQKYLLDREARRNERRNRRERRYLEQQNKRTALAAPPIQVVIQQPKNTNNREPIASDHLMEQNRIGTKENKRASPPNFPPPPTPCEDEESAVMAIAIAASKRQYVKDEEMRRKKQRRAISTSPMHQKKSNITTGSVEKSDRNKGLEAKIDLPSPNNKNGRHRSSSQLPSAPVGWSNKPSAPPIPSYFLKQSDFT